MRAGDAHSLGHAISLNSPCLFCVVYFLISKIHNSKCTPDFYSCISSIHLSLLKPSVHSLQGPGHDLTGWPPATAHEFVSLLVDFCIWAWPTHPYLLELDPGLLFDGWLQGAA